jgi:dTDP-4-dehydrorhamnose reductase
MKIFLIGASGSIGWPLFNFLKKKNFKVIGTYNNNFKKKLLKFKISNSLSKLSNNINHEDVFVLLAAETNVSWVRKNPKKSFKINSYQTIKLIKKISKFGSKIIYFSSAEIFDGKKGYYKESSLGNPINVYGKTKNEVEKFLLKSKSINYKIVRTGRNVNMSLKYSCMIQDTYNTLLNAKAKMAVDNLFTITHANDLIKGILKLLKYKGREKIYHICSNTVISRTNLAEMIIKNSIYGNLMRYKTVKFENILYKEPRAAKNNLSSKLTIKKLKIIFKKPEIIVREKVKLLDKLNEKYITK